MSETKAKYESGRRVDPDDIKFNIDTTEGINDDEDRFALMRNLNSNIEANLDTIIKIMKKYRVLLVVLQDRELVTRELKERLNAKESAVSNLLFSLEAYKRD